MRLEVVSRSPTFGAASMGMVALTVWDGAATGADASVAVSLLNSVARREDQVALFGVLGPNAPPAPPEVRNAISDAIKALGDRVVAAATVVEGAGFRSAAMRGALIGMGMLIRSSYPHKIYNSVGEAAAFLAKYETRATAASLTAAVAELRG